MNALTYAPHEAPTAAPAPHARRCANFFARPRPDCDPFPIPPFTAWLNHTDRIISLPSHWDRFADMIGAPGLERDSVLGRPLTWFIEDETARELFRTLLERARREGRPARITARCDAPDEPRAVQLRLIPMSAGAVECSWSFLQGSAALEIPPLKTHGFGEDEHVRMCSWCRRIHQGGAWQTIEAALPALGALDGQPMPPITHGICPQCAASATSGGHLRAI